MAVEVLLAQGANPANAAVGAVVDLLVCLVVIVPQVAHGAKVRGEGGVTRDARLGRLLDAGAAHAHYARDSGARQLMVCTRRVLVVAVATRVPAKAVRALHLHRPGVVLAPVNFLFSILPSAN